MLLKFSKVCQTTYVTCFAFTSKCLEQVIARTQSKSHILYTDSLSFSGIKEAAIQQHPNIKEIRQFDVVLQMQNHKLKGNSISTSVYYSVLLTFQKRLRRTISRLFRSRAGCRKVKKTFFAF